MTFLIAAAGTGGHVFPGLSVGEGLVDLGVDPKDVVYVGGDRLESTVYPSQGYRFVQVELAGLQRSLTWDNARIPRVVLRARNRIAEEIGLSHVRVVLGMGGYVTIPAGLAARKRRVPFFNAEQNARAGLANKLAARWAQATFVAFAHTEGLPRGQWVGNPVRSLFWSFDRKSLGAEALERYDLSDGVPVLGVFGGSLGAGVINEAVASLVEQWEGPPMQVVHLTGATQLEPLLRRSPASSVTWRRIGFEERMDLFFAACDAVVSRAGGSVAEITATGTPSILVPGRFGSGGHQVDNARFLSEAGASITMGEEELEMLPEVVGNVMADTHRLSAMTKATVAIAKPDAARTIARIMIEATRR